MEKRADKLRSATTDEERRALALPPAGPREGRAGRLLGGGGEAARDEQVLGIDSCRSCPCRTRGRRRSIRTRAAPLPPPRRRDQGRRRRREGAYGGQARLLSSLAVFFDFALFSRDPTLFEASETRGEGRGERDAFIAALKAKAAY